MAQTTTFFDMPIEGISASAARDPALAFATDGHIDGSPIAKIRTEIATAFAWLKSRRAEPAGA